MLSVGAIQLLIMLLGLLRSKLLSIVLGPSGFGLVGTIDQLVLAVISLGTLGLPFVALKFMARDHSENAGAFRRTYSGFLGALAFLGILTGFVGAAVALLTPAIFGQHLAQYGTLIAIAMLGVPAAMVNILVANALAASQRGGRSALYMLVIQAVLLLAVAVGVFAGGVTGLYVAVVSAGAVSTISGIILLRASLGAPSARDARWLASEVRRNPKIMSYSAWAYIAAAVYAMTMSALRAFVFSRYGATNAGLLQADLSLALAVGAVINPMSNLLLTPFVNRSIPALDKLNAANQFAARVLTLLLVVSVPIVLFPHLAVSLLFARTFGPAAGFLFVFIMWQCVAQLVNVYTQLLIGLDDVRFACVAICISYGTSLLIAPAMLSLFGLPGVAFALMAGAIIGGATNATRLKRQFNAPISRTALVRLLFLLGAMGLAASVAALTSERSIAGTLIKTVFALSVIALQWKLLDNAEVAWLKSRLRR